MAHRQHQQCLVPGKDMRHDTTSPSLYPWLILTPATVHLWLLAKLPPAHNNHNNTQYVQPYNVRNHRSGRITGSMNARVHRSGIVTGMTCVTSIIRQIEPNNIDQAWNHTDIEERSKWRLVIKDELTSMIQKNVLSPVKVKD